MHCCGTTSPWHCHDIIFVVSHMAFTGQVQALIINLWCKEPKCLCWNDDIGEKWVLCAVNPDEPGQKPSAQGSTLGTGMWNLSLNPSQIPHSWQALNFSFLPSPSSLYLSRPLSLSFQGSWQWNCRLHSGLINILQMKTTKLVNRHTLSTLCISFLLVILPWAQYAPEGGLCS